MPPCFRPNCAEMEGELLRLAALSLVSSSAPFTHTRTLPIHTITNILSSYLALLATAAKDNAELAGRNQVTAWDVIRSLNEFGEGDLGELREEALRTADGAGEQGDRIRELATQLRGNYKLTQARLTQN